MNVFRKPYLAAFMVSLFIFFSSLLFSCKQYDDPSKIIDAQTLKNGIKELRLN